MPSKSLFPQYCLSSGSSMVGLMETSSKRAYATPRSAAPRPLPLWQSTSDLYLQETFKHSSGSVSVGPGVHKVCLSLLSISGGWGLILSVILPLLQSFWGFSFAPGYWVSPQSCSRAAQLLLQHLPSCWGFSALGHGVSPHSHSQDTHPSYISNGHPWI